jgi:arginyl-tRNA synthetase
MKKELEEILNSILKTEGITEPQAHVDFVADLTRGEFFTNAALVYGKILKINPLDLAEKIVAQINIHLNNSKKDLEFIERVEIAGPGFINFYLTAKSILEILDTDTKHYGLGNNLSGQKNNYRVHSA